MLHNCRCRRRAYVPTSNTTNHDNHEKINSRVSFSFLYEYGASLGGASGWRSFTIIIMIVIVIVIAIEIAIVIVIMITIIIMTVANHKFCN